MRVRNARAYRMHLGDLCARPGGLGSFELANEIHQQPVVRVLILALFLILTSCEPDELPVPPHKKGNLTTTTVELEPDYRYQVFYDLETNTEISRNLKTEWDLGFEASPNGTRVILNSSKAMQAFDTESNEITGNTSRPTSGWRWDTPDGNLETTAIGDWENTVFVIDRGYDHLGNQKGYKKIRILSVDDDKFQIEYASLNGEHHRTLEIPKDNRYNFSFFSFDEGGKIVMIEPRKTEWDLVFTQYTTIFNLDTEPTFYLVTGVLQNRNSTWAVQDTAIGFETFSYQELDRVNFSEDINVLGYNWKSYTHETGSFEIHTEQNYILKDEQDFYYKLHFIDYYNKNGEKGSPTFEYQRL